MKRQTPTWLAAIVMIAASTAHAESNSEKEAVSLFYRLCVLTGGKKEAVDKNMEPIIAANAGGLIPSASLQEKTGIKADYAWAIRLGASRQQTLLTLSPGFCALHLNDGNATIVTKEFLKAAEQTAKSVGAKLRKVEEKKQLIANYSMHAIDVPNAPNELALGLSTADTLSPSGTKHLMTFSIVKKSQE